MKYCYNERAQLCEQVGQQIICRDINQPHVIMLSHKEIDIITLYRKENNTVLDDWLKRYIKHPYTMRMQSICFEDKTDALFFLMNWFDSAIARVKG